MATAHASDLNPEDIERSIPNLLEQQARRRPEQVAVKSKDGSLNYRELNQMANRVAWAILDQLGQKEEPVAILMENDIFTVAAFLGVLKAGKFYVPLDPAYPVHRLTAVLSHSQAKLIVTNDKTMQLAKTLGYAVLNLDNLDPGLSQEDPKIPLTPDRRSLLLFTSGSTGEPKGVLTNHRNLLHQGMRYARALGMGATDCHSQIHSLTHAASLKNLFGTFLMGGGLFLYDLKEEGLMNLGPWLNREGITICAMVSSTFRHFVQTLTGAELFPQLRVMCVQAEPLYRRDVELFVAHFPPSCQLVHEMGSSETGPILYYPVGRFTDSKSVVVPAGFPFDGITIRLLNETGNPVQPNQTGQIVVQSKYLALGYWGNPALSQGAFHPDPEGGEERLYYTGDLGRMLPDGAIQHLGRKDDQVKIRGHRVEIAEVEMALLTHPNVKEAAVTTRAGHHGDKRLAAYIIPRGQAPGPGELRHWLKKGLPDFMVPSHFAVLDKLPLTPTGKLDRRALPDLEETLTGAEAQFPKVPPSDAIELHLTDIWRKVLGVPSVGVEENFFDLGGDSLLALVLFVEIEKKLGFWLPPAILLQAATIKELAQVIRQKKQLVELYRVAVIQKGDSVLPLFLVHTVEGNVFKYRDLASLLGDEQPVYGLLPNELYGKEIHYARMEDIARFCIDSMRRVQPSGPYCLGGFCYGGVVAFEMARQLQLEGDRVALVAIFEAEAPLESHQRDQLWRPRWILLFLRNLPRWMRQNLPNRCGGLARHIRLRLLVEARDLLKRTRTRGGQMIPPREPEDHFGDLTHVPDRVRSLLRVNFQALHRYQALPYPGRVTLFRPQALPLFEPCDPELGWGRVAKGGVEVKLISGNHFTLMLRPHVESLAAALNKSLRQVHKDRVR